MWRGHGRRLADGEIHFSAGEDRRDDSEAAAEATRWRVSGDFHVPGPVAARWAPAIDQELRRIGAAPRVRRVVSGVTVTAVVDAPDDGAAEGRVEDAVTEVIGTAPVADLGWARTAWVVEPAP